METVPQLSVVISIDFHAGDRRAWDELRDVLRALSQQDGIEKAEVLLVEDESLRDTIPDDLGRCLPGLRIVLANASSAAALKNVGAAQARSNLIATLDGDCVPAPGWIAGCLEAAQRHPEAAVVSGRTLYPNRSLAYRAMALLNRSYIEGDDEGRTEHVSHNNAVYRRAALQEVPFGDTAGTHSSRLQSEALRRSGAKFAFSDGMTVIHAFAGWATERRIRADLGYSVVRVRQEDPELPHAWMTRFGMLSLPVVFTARVGHSWLLCFRHARTYGLSWAELPVALALAVLCCAQELPGAARALRGEPRRASEFR